MPPLSGPARTFAFDRQLSYSVRSFTQESRFILYDNGAFVLQYGTAGGYPGKYSESNGVIAFEWQGWNAAGPWGASGLLTDDTLSVKYNLIMQMSDFEDAIYVRR